MPQSVPDRGIALVQ